MDVNTQARSVFISINNSNNEILVGEYMTALFSTVTINDAMEIPRSAVFNQNEVFIINNNKLKKAQINVIKVNNTSVLFNGLDKGTIVVAEPLINAIEGSVVKRIENSRE